MDLCVRLCGTLITGTSVSANLIGIAERKTLASLRKFILKESAVFCHIPPDPLFLSGNESAGRLGAL
jgi:hypothetical protein